MNRNTADRNFAEQATLTARQHGFGVKLTKYQKFKTAHYPNLLEGAARYLLRNLNRIPIRRKSASTRYSRLPFDIGQITSSLGEVSGPEARTLLDAMKTGHDGTLPTIHASTPQGALQRLAALAIRASGQMTVPDAQDEVKRSIGIVLQMARQFGHRRDCEGI